MGNDILKKIVESDGSCTGWASPTHCQVCPLSKLKQKPDGNFLSCVEALNIEDMTEAEADARYKDVAVRILLDQEIEDMLRESHVSE